MLSSSYNPVLVAFSFIVAILASYTALKMAARVTSSRGKAAAFWLAGGSFAMGFGIWAMHFIGMLAFDLPIPLGYDVPLTLLSLLIAVFSSAFALWLVCQQNLPHVRLVLGGSLMGAGIAAMHYTGMAALRMQPSVIYLPWMFALSIVIAVLASVSALWIVFRLRRNSRSEAWARVGASLLMGCAIVGMHYTGMAAAQFPLGSYCEASNSGIDVKWLAVVVITVSLAVLAIALIVSVLDVRSNLLSVSLDQANSELLQLALHDNLTRLPNRLLLSDRLNQAIHRGTRNEGRFSVLLMDLDGFKAVNDAYGHHVGDLLLMEVSERILASKHPADTAARLGGDEFVFLTQSATPVQAAQLAQALTEAIGRPYSIEGHALHISASIGIALFPDHGRSARELLVNADAAMYHAKERGREGYCFFESTMNKNAHEQMQLHHDLRQAVEHGEFVLHYQPKFVAADGSMIGVEALVRWHKPGVGLVPPDRFLPHAERTGLIVPIGNWVIDEACRQIRHWHDQGHGHWSMAVNLSTIQLAHADLLDVIRGALQKYALAPRYLVLEITESTAMRKAEVSLEILERLAELGVNISIDDFGTGYSSLLYLKRFPANELKIDRGFVKELVEGNEDEAIISAIIALGRTLDMKIVAEGVETPQQQALLTRLGCHALQGYLLGRPLAAEQLLESLAATGRLRGSDPFATSDPFTASC